MNGVNIMLGVNTRTKKCCIISSNMTFNQTAEFLNKFPAADLIVRHDSTNWGGCDDISRACERKNVSPTGQKLKYKKTLHGADSDHGHRYDWKFEYNEIWEVKPL